MTRPPTDNTLAITFFYYRDLAAACVFYEQVLGLTLAIDQGWSKIYRVADGAHIGLVDEARGMNKWADIKPVQFCIRTPDVDAWYQWCGQAGVTDLSDMFENDALGIRAFVFRDPEGYQIEIQQALRAGA